MGSLAALMVAELGVILYVAKLGDPDSVLSRLATPWREMAMVWLVCVIGLLSVGSFLALRAAVTGPNTGLDSLSQIVVIAAVMSGIAALIVAPLWGYARELRPVGSVLMLFLPVVAGVSAAALLLRTSSSPGGSGTFGQVFGLVTALVSSTAAAITGVSIVGQRRANPRRGAPDQRARIDPSSNLGVESSDPEQKS